MSETRDAAEYATYYNIDHTTIGVLSSNSLMYEIANHRPVAILIGYYNSNNVWVNGHFLVVVGYRNRYLGNNQVEFLTYDVLNSSSIQRYNWITYSDLISGSGTYLNRRKYTGTVYSLK